MCVMRSGIARASLAIKYVLITDDRNVGERQPFGIEDQRNGRAPREHFCIFLKYWMEHAQAKKWDCGCMKRLERLVARR